MQPNNQQPQTVIPPSGQNGGSEYDFISSTPDTPKKMNPLNGNNTFQKVIVLAALLAIVLIVFLVGRSLLAPKSNTAELLAVAQNQQQVIALNNSALDVPSLSVSNRNFAITTKSVVTSDQKVVLGYLAKKKIKTSDELLNKKIDTEATKTLTDSIANNTYNENFKKVMKEKIQLYQDSLLPAYNTSTTQKGKDLFNGMSESNDLLLKMLNN